MSRAVAHGGDRQAPDLGLQAAQLRDQGREPVGFAGRRATGGHSGDVAAHPIAERPLIGGGQEVEAQPCAAQGIDLPDDQMPTVIEARRRPVKVQAISSPRSGTRRSPPPRGR